MKFKLLLLFLPVMLLSCANQSDIKNESRKVIAAAAIIREQPDQTRGFGSLSFVSKVDITAPQEGIISRIFSREGDIVNQGQVVVQLENPQINLAVERAVNNYSQTLAAMNLAESRLLEGLFAAEAQLLALDKADAELDLAKRRWEETRRKHLAQETLFEAGGIHTEAILVSRFSLDTEMQQIELMERELAIRRIGSREQDLVRAGIPVPLGEYERKNALVFLMTSSLRAELEAAIARHQAAEKELASANIALAQLTIRSPASGIIGARYLEEGERVRPSDNILSLINTDLLYAIFPVREKDAMRIEKGMPASVLVDGTNETREAIVDLIYPQADSQSLSFLVRVLMENKIGLSANRLKPGMFARVTVTLGEPGNAVFIPESAIFNLRNNEGNVFVINGSILSERKIILGISDGEDREVIAGLNAGEIVVLRPEPDLREGTNVTITE